MKQKKEYIKPESLIQKIYDEEGVLIHVTAGEHHGGFPAKQHDLVIEDDYDDDVDEEQPLTLKSFKPWDDGEAKDDKTLTW